MCNFLNIFIYPVLDKIQDATYTSLLDTPVQSNEIPYPIPAPLIYAN